MNKDQLVELFRTWLSGLDMIPRFTLYHSPEGSPEGSPEPSPQGHVVRLDWGFRSSKQAPVVFERGWFLRELAEFSLATDGSTDAVVELPPEELPRICRESSLRIHWWTCSQRGSTPWYTSH